jgi:EAL domain-containing protein (putative c-di-GMP-specific phosphodiesterase class I)
MQLLPYFQPIVDIATGKVIGHEVLARTYDLEGNIKSAGYLFSDPELDEQQVLAYDRAVRLQAIQRFAEAGQPGFLTINISPRWIDLLEDEWIPTIEMLELYCVSPEKIVIEIVETNSNPEKLLHIVQRYKAIGMRIAVDDFGSGCSQFDRVIKLEPDIVKLDMHLFKKAMQGGLSQDIVQSLSFLAERMGSQILCEGVETYPELRFALDIGSKLIQGYMFSEAKEQFSNDAIFTEDIAEKRRQFLLEGIRKEEKIIEDSRQIHKEVTRLCKQIRNAGNLDNLHWIESEQILSLFICDIDGAQISPTFRVNPEGIWKSCNEKIGHNWSWRPYFYQLISGADTMQRLSVTSRSYHDVTTGMLVKTIARFVDKDRILMVDIKEEKSFLYAAEVL